MPPMRISERARDGSASDSDSSDGEAVVKKPIFKSKRPNNARKRVYEPEPTEIPIVPSSTTKEDSPPPFKKRATKTKAPDPEDAMAEDGNYKGATSYKSFVQKNPDAPSKKVGPMKAPANVRTITITDYKPDVCKDYKQTGFCGFGDSCIFLHSREDYKQGWQLDKEWENVTKGKKNLAGTVVSSRSKKAGEAEDSDDEAVLDGIPFACVICKEDYKNPIVTKCGHYFCESCALGRFRKTPACAICGAGTGGVFNGAKRLRKLLEKKRVREEAKEAEEEEEA